MWRKRCGLRLSGGCGDYWLRSPSVFKFEKRSTVAFQLMMKDRNIFLHGLSLADSKVKSLLCQGPFRLEIRCLLLQLRRLVLLACMFEI